MIFYAFHIKYDFIRDFLKEVERGDDMRGSKIVTIKSLRPRVFLVVIKRKYDYPFVINQLRKHEGRE